MAANDSNQNKKSRDLSRIGTFYDIRKSGVGYLLAAKTRPNRCNMGSFTGRLLQVTMFQTICCTHEIIDDYASRYCNWVNNLLGFLRITKEREMMIRLKMILDQRD